MTAAADTSSSNSNSNSNNNISVLSKPVLDCLVKDKSYLLATRFPDLAHIAVADPDLDPQHPISIPYRRAAMHVLAAPVLTQLRAKSYAPMVLSAVPLTVARVIEAAAVKRASNLDGYCSVITHWLQRLTQIGPSLPAGLGTEALSALYASGLPYSGPVPTSILTGTATTEATTTAPMDAENGLGNISSPIALPLPYGSGTNSSGPVTLPPPLQPIPLGSMDGMDIMNMLLRTVPQHSSSSSSLSLASEPINPVIAVPPPPQHPAVEEPTGSPATAARKRRRTADEDVLAESPDLGSSNSQGDEPSGRQTRSSRRVAAAAAAAAASPLVPAKPAPATRKRRAPAAAASNGDQQDVEEEDDGSPPAAKVAATGGTAATRKRTAAAAAAVKGQSTPPPSPTVAKATRSAPAPTASATTKSSAQAPSAPVARRPSLTTKPANSTGTPASTAPPPAGAPLKRPVVPIIALPATGPRSSVAPAKSAPKPAAAVAKPPSGPTKPTAKPLPPKVVAVVAAPPPPALKPLLASDAFWWCADTEELIAAGYPTVDKCQAFIPAAERNPAVMGAPRKCARCDRAFEIRDPPAPFPDMTNGSVPFYNECRFHPMRLSTKQVSGTRTRLHECCQGQMGDAGCDVGPHVWEEHRGGDKLLAHLHAEIAFAVTPETCTGGTGMRRGVVGLDCEMVYSTCGLELARVSLVDGADHSVLVDELVRPKGAVLDYNTRYSGITSLKSTTITLEEVRALVFQYIDQDTIIVGHSLDSDFKALRIIHPTVVDTAMLFKTPSGGRRALRTLTAQFLGRFIQQKGDEGHDSLEDAIAPLDILRKKIANPSLRM